MISKEKSRIEEAVLKCAEEADPDITKEEFKILVKKKCREYGASDARS